MGRPRIRNADSKAMNIFEISKQFSSKAIAFETFPHIYLCFCSVHVIIVCIWRIFTDQILLWSLLRGSVSGFLVIAYCHSWRWKNRELKFQYCLLMNCLHAYVHAKLLQSCLTLCHPLDCNLQGFFVHGILQGRILEWVSRPSSRGSSQPRDHTQVSYVSCTGGWVLYP